MLNQPLQKIRDLIGDNLKSNNDSPDVFEFISANVFTLSESSLDSSSITVYKNGILWASSNYTYSSATNKITTSGTLVVGDILTVYYNYNSKYTDNELRGYLRAALTYLSVENYAEFSWESGDVIFPTPMESEICLIALIAKILIEPVLTSYRTPEISMSFVENQPKEKKIKIAIKQFSKNFGTFLYIRFDRSVDPDNEDSQII